MTQEARGAKELVDQDRHCRPCFAGELGISAREGALQFPPEVQFWEPSGSRTPMRRKPLARHHLSRTCIRVCTLIPSVHGRRAYSLQSQPAPTQSGQKDMFA